MLLQMEQYLKAPAAAEDYACTAISASVLPSPVSKCFSACGWRPNFKIYREGRGAGCSLIAPGSPSALVNCYEFTIRHPSLDSICFIIRVQTGR